MVSRHRGREGEAQEWSSRPPAGRCSTHPPPRPARASTEKKGLKRLRPAADSNVIRIYSTAGSIKSGNFKVWTNPGESWSLKRNNIAFGWNLNKKETRQNRTYNWFNKRKVITILTQFFSVLESNFNVKQPNKASLVYFFRSRGYSFYRQTSQASRNSKNRIMKSVAPVSSSVFKEFCRLDISI